MDFEVGKRYKLKESHREIEVVEVNVYGSIVRIKYVGERRGTVYDVAKSDLESGMGEVSALVTTVDGAKYSGYPSFIDPSELEDVYGIE